MRSSAEGIKPFLRPTASSTKNNHGWMRKTIDMYCLRSTAKERKPTLSRRSFKKKAAAQLSKSTSKSTPYGQKPGNKTAFEAVVNFWATVKVLSRNKKLFSLHITAFISLNVARN